MPFVNLSTSDVGFDLVALIEKVTEPTPPDGKTQSPLAKLVEEKKYQELFEVGVFGKMDSLLSGASEQEVDSCFSLCFTLLNDLAPQHVGDTISRLASSLSSNPTHAKIKLHLLSVLFNLLESASPLRSSILLHMLRLGTSSNHAELLINEFPRIEQWMTQWTVTEDYTAEVLLLMSEAYEQTNKTLPRQVCLLKYLKTFQGADASRLAQSIEPASAAALFAIQEPTVHQVDPLLDLAAIQNLERKDAPQNEKNLFRLLQIFALEDVAAFNAFTTEQKDALSSLGLDAEAASAKIRRLSLISLAANVEQVTYQDVQSSLQLSTEEDVEETVIDAVALGIMDAKLDQENAVVIVNRVDQRSFTGDAPSWSGLSQSLGRWLNNIDDVLNSLPDFEQPEDEQY